MITILFIVNTIILLFKYTTTSLIVNKLIKLQYIDNNIFNVWINNCDHSMLRYLLKFVCFYLYMYMLSSITFGYNLFNEIFINVKFLDFLNN